MKHGNGDPSRSGGNNSKLKKTVAAGTMLTLAMLGAMNDSGQVRTSAKSESSSIEALQPITIDRLESELLKLRVKGMAIDFATDVLDRFNSGGKDLQQKWVSESAATPGYYDVSIAVDASTLLDGDYGQYYFSLSVGKDKRGNFDPRTVDGIFLGMDVRKDSVMKGGFGELYGFEMLKVNFDGEEDWRVVVGEMDKGGNRTTTFYSTGNEAINSSVLRVLTPEALDRRVSQAAVVYQWANTTAPVNYPPAA